MKRSAYKTLVVLIFVILLVGCNQEVKIKYSLPSDNQISEYIKENNLNPLVIRKEKESVTILDEISIHSISIFKKNGKLSKVVSKWGTTSNDVSILSNPQVNEGKPNVILVINNHNLLESAKKIEITFNDDVKVTESINGNKGFIMDYPTETKLLKHYKEINILDSNNKSLYQSPQ